LNPLGALFLLLLRGDRVYLGNDFCVLAAARTGQQLEAAWLAGVFPLTRFLPLVFREVFHRHHL